MKRKIKAESVVSILIAIGLFSLMATLFFKWQSDQHHRKIKLYQEQQAWQILENQIALELVGLDCEKKIKQNDIVFKIDCSLSEISVEFPLGKIRLEKP